ncbi:MAG: hypothetical protein P4L55_19455 [Syntrophobacteraceae bacterium]|nr:hypothetical protein [Syntrophobacteraceae bacterium]
MPVKSLAKLIDGLSARTEKKNTRFQVSRGQGNWFGKDLPAFFIS